MPRLRTHTYTLNRERGRERERDRERKLASEPVERAKNARRRVTFQRVSKETRETCYFVGRQSPTVNIVTAGLIYGFGLSNGDNRAMPPALVSA